MQPPLAQVDLIPPQGDQFRYTQGMTVADQDHSGITMTVPASALGSDHQLADFLLGQIFPAPDILILWLSG
jgi:hypothetical protein